MRRRDLTDELTDGLGGARHEARFDSLSAPIARIHRALMNEFDPHAVFDRERLLPAQPAH